MIQVKTWPGTDCGGGCHHVSAVARKRVKVEKNKKNRSVRKDWRVLIRNDTIKESLAVEVWNRNDRLSYKVENDGVQRDWRVLQKVLLETAKVIIPKKRRRIDKPWMAEVILSLMDERRKMNSCGLSSNLFVLLFTSNFEWTCGVGGIKGWEGG